MNDQVDSAYLRVIVERILNAETNDARFETFANSIVSGIEGGARVLSTSTTWDRGRDGFGVGVLRGVYVCSSLRDDVELKAISDIERITDTTKSITRLYVCSSQSLSEHRKDSLRESLEKLTSNAFPITVLAANDLSQYATERVDLVDRHYGAEKADIIRVTTTGPADSTELRGLRLAMLSTAADDSESIRREVYSTAILELLSDGVPKTIALVGKAIGEQLRLGRSLTATALTPHLDSLIRSNLVDLSGAAYRLTSTGASEWKSRSAAGAGRLLALRQSVRDALESAIGERIVDDEFTRIWAVFEERMAHYFHSRGESLMEEVAALLEDRQDGPAEQEPQALSFLNELATAVGATTSHPARRAELTQAVRDLFADRQGPAAQWLVRISAHFLATCAMGLEHATAVALQKLFGRTTLILDTDVVLSLLGEGEPEHDGVKEIVQRWRRLGGKLLAPDPVLEEVARHAWIATADYGYVAHLIPGSVDDRLHLIGNAFVRSFAEFVSRGELRAHQWEPYIQQFVGEQEYDWQQVKEVLSAEYKVDRLPARSLSGAAFEKEVREFLVKLALQPREGVPPDAYAEDKARRDAVLYVAMIEHLDKLREQDPASACLIVSSTKRLMAAEAHFRRSNERQLVVSIGAMLHMLSLIPDVQLGLSAMKAFLFDERRNRFSSDLERMLLRMIKGSSGVALPIAKRGVLMRAVRGKILKEAAEKGERGSEDALVRQYEREALKPEHQRQTMEMLSKALDEIGIDPKLQKENVQLKKQIVDLEEQLAREKERSRKK